MKKKLMLFSYITSLIFITACGDMKDVQHINFASALGIDFKNGKYYAYVQMISFSNVAKSEGGTAGPPIEYVGKGVGYTPNEALIKVMKTGQNQFYWNHVTAIVLSESAIQKDYISIFDSVSRHSDLTLTPWVFGTKAPMEKIFTVNGFFNRTSLDTILHDPMVNFLQHPTIKPKQLYESGREITEPHFTTYLPSLAVNNSQWKENIKKEPKLTFDGAFFLQNEHFNGFYTIDQLKGLRWITKEAQSINLLIPNQKSPNATVIISPKVKYQENTSQNQPTLNVLIGGNGYIIELNTNERITKSELEKEVSTQIKKEIDSLYQLGLKHKTDFLNLEHKLYRDDYYSWKKVAEKPNLLQNIDVNINIKHAASNKNQKLDIHKIQ